MRESQSPRTPQGRVRIYERLGRAGGSPARTIGIAVVLLIIVIAIILAQTRYTRRAGAQGADMTPPATVRVTGPGDVRGTINTAEWPLDGSRAEVLVERERGAPVLVPLEALARQDDGTYRLTFDPAALERPYSGSDARQEPPMAVPVTQERLHVGTRPVETGRGRIERSASGNLGSRGAARFAGGNDSGQGPGRRDGGSGGHRRGRHARCGGFLSPGEEPRAYGGGCVGPDSALPHTIVAHRAGDRLPPGQEHEEVTGHGRSLPAASARTPLHALTWCPHNGGNAEGGCPMPHRADEIRRDIEGTRAAMTEKVGMVVERAQEQMEAVKATADRAMTGFRQVQETVEGAKSTTNTVEECERRMEAIRTALQRVEALIDYWVRVRAALQSMEAAEKRLAFEASDIRVTWTPGQRPRI
jgi:hypothetical protein